MRWLGSITDSVGMTLSKLGDSEEQGSLACCSPWGRKELDTIQQLNNSNWEVRWETGCDELPSPGEDPQGERDISRGGTKDQ